MALSQTLNEPIDPFASISRIGSAQDVQSRADIASKELEPVMRGLSTEREIGAATETGFRRRKAQAETAAEQDFATGRRRATEEYQAGLEARPIFNPTEFDAKSAGELATLTALVGAIAGGGRARAGLRSISSFSKGAREGRQQLYDREVKQFERDIQAWKDNLGLAREKLTQVIDLLSTDKGAALAKAKELDPLLQDGVALSKVRQQDFNGALEVIKNAMKAGDQLDIALSKAAGKSSDLKPGVDLVNKHLMKMRLSTYARQMQDQLKDPEFAKKVDEYRALAFAQEQSPIADQILQKNIPEDIRAFLILAKRFRNEVYRTESGLAVTAYEQLRQYGAVPQPGDSARALVTKLQTLERGMKDDISNEQRIFPALAEAGQRQGLIPVPPVAARPTVAAPKAGEVVQGYRFKGGDPADRNNWERVE
jgi:hypothetical protein